MCIIQEERDRQPPGCYASVIHMADVAGLRQVEVHSDHDISPRR